MSLLTSDYEFSLPDELIARHPLPRRQDSRMMVLHRAAQRIEHRQFADFPTFTQPGDLVVLNNTRVIPARVYSDDGRVELLFLESVGDNLWKCLVKPGRRMTPGKSVEILGNKGTVTEVCPDGERIIAFAQPVDLDKAGELPLPPYFEREVEPADEERYQTVYATHRGSVAAPTAGLHFTPEILQKVAHTFLTLHVGVGTFRPVQADSITEHRMHEEKFHVTAEAAQAINAAQRVIAIGTTSARVLESCGRPITPCEGSTNIFIYPSYRFRSVDALLTNFHLPRSTLLMLVCALAGKDFALHAYSEAVRQKYRFYSYGDCMLIL